jgi:hypothetical protein
MKAIILTTARLSHQLSWGDAFRSGLRRHGWDAEISDKVRPCDLLVMWGVRRTAEIAQQKARGGEVCILERGYVGDRFTWTSVSFGGGLNGRATFRGPFDDSSRWRKHFARLISNDWIDVSQRRTALIMGQVPSDNSVRGVNLPEFYSGAHEAFKRQGYQIRLRPHPHGRTGVTPIAVDMQDAALVVTWNSNSGVDAVLAGVPAIAMDKGSMAWAVTGHELHPPPTPDRTAWMHAIAWKQWLKEEIASGVCWEHVKP